MLVVREASEIAQANLDSVKYTTPASENGKFFVCACESLMTDAGVITEVYHPISTKRHVSEADAMKELKTLMGYQA